MKWLPPAVALLVGLIGGYFLFAPDEPPAAAHAETALSERANSPPAAAVDHAPARSSSKNSKVAKSGISSAWLKSLEQQTQFDQIGSLHAQLKSVSSADFPAIIDSLGDSTQAMNWMVRSMLATKWAESDPTGMLAYVESRPERERWGMQNMLFGAWAKTDLNAALAAARGLADGRYRSSAIQAVIRTVAGEDSTRALLIAESLEDRRSRSSSIQAIIQTVAAADPQGAIAIAEQQMDSGALRSSSYLFSNIFSQWARRDAGAARQAALAMPDSPMKVKALWGALQQWVSTDPIAALNWLDSLPVDSSVYNSRKEVFRHVLNQDFDVAKEFIEAESDSVARREILSNLYVGNFAWNKSYEEIESIFDWVGTVATGSMYDQKVSDVVRSMAESDPDRAMDFMLQMRPGNARMSALGSISSILAERDPVAALAFVQTLAYEDEKKRALSGMGHQMSKHGVLVASELITSSEDPLVQRQLASRVVGEWMKYDRAAALTFVESLSDDQARNRAVGSILNHWIQSEPAEAIDYMVTELPENQLGSNLSSAFSQWARQDPEAAVAWLDQLPEGAEAKQADIYNRVAQAYVQHDPMAASEWIATLDEDGSRRGL